MTRELRDRKNEMKRSKVEEEAPETGQMQVEEEIYECPYCNHQLSSVDLEKAICPNCAQKFVTGEEEELVIYECPHCSRSITEDVVRKGKCPFCSGTFSM